MRGAVGRLAAWRGVIKVRLAAVGGAVALAVTGIVPGALGASAAAGTASATQGFTIVRSAFGVPTITAGSQAGMWFGAGWAQAQDRMAQLELTRRAVEGTLSQIFGPSQLGQDETVRTFFYTPAELRAQYQSLPAATRAGHRRVLRRHQRLRAVRVRQRDREQQQVPVEFFVLGQALGPDRALPPGALAARSTPSPSATTWPGEFGGGGGSELQNLQLPDVPRRAS